MSFKILFITQDDPFYVRLFFDEFFGMYPNLDEIRGVVIAQAMGKKSLSQLARQMFDFYGSFDFLRMGFKYVFYRLLSSAPAWIVRNGFYSLKKLCRSYRIPVMQQSDIGAKPFLKMLKGLDLDLIVSVAAPVIFKENLIFIPKHGCINIHNGKLPKYRGMLPNFWQMYYGEKTVGVTIHEINTGIDDGRIILQRDVMINPDETLESLIKRTKRIGAHFMVEAIELIKAGNVLYRENPTQESSYFTFPTRTDVKEFKRRGKRIM
jgi:methionyl-tRNA formyltransferase